jgi:hypothetical protein
MLSAYLMSDWRKLLKYDPLPPLLESNNSSIIYFTKRDLMRDDQGSTEIPWSQKYATKLLHKQREDGSWRYPSKRSGEKYRQDYDQLETYRNLTQLVDLYEINRNHPAIQRASEYLFTKQTPEGDFRGIYGAQYTPNYSAAIMETLIKAGYGSDERVEAGFRWLTSSRQSDGGWAIPIRTSGCKIFEALASTSTVVGDQTKPSSHMVTGVVLRAFAAHGEFRRSDVARDAGALLRDSLFQKDVYPDRATVDYWIKFTFPFWFTDLLSALDSLSKIGFTLDDEEISAGLSWFTEEQNVDGGWRLNLLKGKSIPNLNDWVTLAVCRVFMRFSENLET